MHSHFKLYFLKNKSLFNYQQGLKSLFDCFWSTLTEMFRDKSQIANVMYILCCYF